MEEIKKKKKRKKRKKRKVKPIDPHASRRVKRPYQIIITCNNKQVSCIGQYTTETNAYRKFTEMIEESKKVLFPVEYKNDKAIENVKYELMIIKKRDDDDPTTTVIRNEFGDYVTHLTSNENWIVLDRGTYFKEETFWVYGYHPHTQRKNISFIVNEIVLPKASCRDTFLNVFIFKNKVLFETFNSLDMVLCKNKHDAIRMYNFIEKWASDNKVKYILFSGDGDCTYRRKKECYAKIMKLTNWSYMKIARNKTNPS